MKEGLEVAKGVVTIPNPKLVNILTFNGDFFTQALGNLKVEFIFEGNNIGKANMWAYTFVDANDVNTSSLIVAIKTILAPTIVAFPLDTNFGDLANFSFTETLDLDKLVNSDEFAKKLIEDSFYSKMKNACLENCNYIIGVASVENETNNCLQAQKISWFIILERISTKARFCCEAAYNDVSVLSCEEYGGIVEKPNEIPINIFPTPTNNVVTINNPNELLISDITIYDLLGNKIAEIAPDATEINVSDLLAGNYFICFTVGNKKLYRSLIII